MATGPDKTLQAHALPLDGSFKINVRGGARLNSWQHGWVSQIRKWRPQARQTADTYMYGLCCATLISPPACTGARHSPIQPQGGGGSEQEGCLRAGHSNEAPGGLRQLAAGGGGRVWV